MEANAVRRTVFNDRIFNSADCKGSKGGLRSAMSTRDRSQEGTEVGRGGFQPPRLSKEPDDQSCLPRRLTINCIVMCGQLWQTYTFRVEGDSLHSNPSSRKESTTLTRTTSGVFPGGRTPINEQVPLQSIEAPFVEGALAEVMVSTMIGVGHLEPPHPVQGTRHELQRVWTRVPKGAPSLRKQILPQRNRPRRGCSRGA